MECPPETQAAPQRVPPFPVVASEELGSRLRAPRSWLRAMTPGSYAIRRDRDPRPHGAARASLLPNSETGCDGENHVTERLGSIEL
jgi:hypothetical protein